MQQLAKACFLVLAVAFVVLGASGVVLPTLDFPQQFGVDFDALRLDALQRASLLDQYRFLKGCAMGFGVFTLAFRREIWTSRKHNRVYLGILFMLVAARLLALALDGMPRMHFVAIVIPFELVTAVLVLLATRRTIVAA